MASTINQSLLRGGSSSGGVDDEDVVVDVVDMDAIDGAAGKAAAAAEERSNVRRELMTQSVLIEPLGWPAAPSVARALATAAGCEVTKVRRAGALVESAAASLAGRELVTSLASIGEASTSAAHLRGVSSLAAAALPLHALRRRLALPSSGDFEDTTADAAAANTPLALAHGLRAAGAALITGAAFGSPGGLTPAELTDAAAWLRCIARRHQHENAAAVDGTDSPSLPPLPQLPPPAPEVGRCRLTPG